MSESYYDQRLREKAEAAAAEKRKRERAAHYKSQQLPEIWKRQAANSAAQAANSAAWCQYVDRRIDQRIREWWGADQERWDTPLDPLMKAIGQELREHRAERRKETKAAVEEVKREFKTALEAFELRLMAHVDRRISEHVAQTTERTSALGDTLARERRDRQTEIKSVVDTAQNSLKAERNANFAALEQRVVQHTDRRINEYVAQTTERTSMLWNMKHSDRRKEIKDTVEEAQSAAETRQAAKLEALEHRVVQHTDQRLTQHIEQCTERTHALSDVIATQRWDRQKEIKAAVDEVKREFKLAVLEQRADQPVQQIIVRTAKRLTLQPLHDLLASKSKNRYMNSFGRRSIRSSRRWSRASKQCLRQSNRRIINDGRRSISGSSA